PVVNAVQTKRLPYQAGREGCTVQQRAIMDLLMSLALPSPGHAPLFHDVSLKELAGLHYYNLAVDLINKQNYYDAFRALKKASFLYPDSERISDFLKITSALYEGRLSGTFVK
ncbi:MAG: hypothetical protein HC859_14185, partial [Bacteroidia bacterium]|nr:hypothetical protein [Bacteroidia bacterium]